MNLAPPETVDIVLPTFRRPHTIAYAVRSVLAQTYPHFVLHVIGDGCDGDTESLVTSFADPRIRFYRFAKATGFGYVHRNLVLQQSDGAFIAYMTDDDLWFPDHLEGALAEMSARDLSLVAFRSIQIRYPDIVDPYFFAFDWRFGSPSMWLRNWFMGAVNCVHRRSVFDLVGVWNERLFRFGDREFYNRVRTSAVRSAYVDRVTVLRFYAQSWDHRYQALTEVPQARYVERLSDEQWRAGIEEALAAPRDWRVRRAQLEDFMAFAVRSGPKFARFWYEKLTC